MSKIYKRLLELKKTIDCCYSEIDNLRSICEHPNEFVKKEPENDADDYDAPGKGVSYWYNCHCTQCDKRWKEDQRTKKILIS